MLQTLTDALFGVILVLENEKSCGAGNGTICGGDGVIDEFISLCS